MIKCGIRVYKFAIMTVLVLLVILQQSFQTVDISRYVRAASQLNPQSQKNLANGQSPFSNSPDGAPYERANATFVSLARNSDLYSLASSILHVEDRFNNKYHYDWVFFNDEPFTEQFINFTSRMVSGKAYYEVIPKQYWSYPEWIDQEKAAKGRQELVDKDIIYGGSESYRHMCRFESGFFWQQKIMDKYKYYWRVEPDIKIYCDIDYDVFKFMESKKLKYSFTISLIEYVETIPTLWRTTQNFLQNRPQYLAADNVLDFISDDKGKSYNNCHFWSNFEIADLDFWRSPAYREYFNYLDKQGGFFYERWGDAPVHSIAASLFLNKSEIHYFDDIGYEHSPFMNCPSDPKIRMKKRCACNPKDNFTWQPFSCMAKYFKVNNKKRPEGWNDDT